MHEPCDSNVDASTDIDTVCGTDGSRFQWQSAYNWPAPKRLEAASSGMPADKACRLASQGVGIVWAGDFHQARALLQAMKRRLSTKSDVQLKAFSALPWPERFHRIRLQRAQTARLLGMLLMRIEPDYQLDYRRAPQAHEALQMAYGSRLAKSRFVVPLTELTGVLSAHEWHRKGLAVATLGQSIYPRWGVFAPTRHEYLELVMQAELPDHCQRAVDVGTGTGVVAMLLARRGIAHVVATDTNPAAVACATDNVTRAGLADRIEVTATHLLPQGQFDLLVCNPPWLPGAANSALEAAVYDPKHQMLRGFLQMAREHLTPNGQAWLILSDLAEHLGLRTRQTLLDWITQAGLSVHHRLDIKPEHRKLDRASDLLATARVLETTSLWQLCSSDETP